MLDKLTNGSLVDKIIVMMKIISYFDLDDIETINYSSQRGGGDDGGAAAGDPAAALATPALATAALANGAGAGTGATALATATPALGTALGAGANANANADATATPALGTGAGANANANAGANGSGPNAGNAINEKPEIEDFNINKNTNPDVEGIDTAKDNNFLLFIIRSILTTTQRIGKMISNTLLKLLMIFIFAATLPALPFFLTMGLMYAIVKYGSLKIRAI